LTTDAPSSDVQFTHYLSLASSSKSDTQRRDALSFLASKIAAQPVDSTIPVSSAAVILPKLLPLILDGSASVRSQLQKLLRLLPAKDIAERAESALLYVRAGMTHLAVDIRNDAVLSLEWLLENAREEVVTCPGGWVKTLKAFMSMMGWTISSGATKWTSSCNISFGKAGKAFPKQLMVLAQFLQAGLGSHVVENEFRRGRHFPLWDLEVHMVPSESNPYAHLNLFGPGRDEDGEMYTERDARRRVFASRFQVVVNNGIDGAKKEGGEVGRAAAVLGRVLKDSMTDYMVIGDPSEG
jgi:pre-rRNA-processing protein IPI1